MSWRGTIVNCVTVVPTSRVEPAIKTLSGGVSTEEILPRSVHLIPFQKERKEEDPSLDLQDF